MKHTGLRLSGTCGEHLIPVRALGIHELQSVAEPFDAVFRACLIGGSGSIRWLARLDGGGAGALEEKAVASSAYEEKRPSPQEIATP